MIPKLRIAHDEYMSARFDAQNYSKWILKFSDMLHKLQL